MIGLLQILPHISRLAYAIRMKKDLLVTLKCSTPSLDDTVKDNKDQRQEYGNFCFYRDAAGALGINVAIEDTDVL